MFVWPLTPVGEGTMGAPGGGVGTVVTTGVG